MPEVTCTLPDNRNPLATCGRPVAERCPWPVCTGHMSEMLEWINTERVATGLKLTGSERGRYAAKRRAAASGPGSVYYLLCGDLIKIGWTSDLPRRFRAYPPNAQLLASEPGDRDREDDRHRQFQDKLAARAEWYTPDAELWEHVRRVRARFGEPLTSTYCDS